MHRSIPRGSAPWLLIDQSLKDSEMLIRKEIADVEEIAKKETRK